MHNHCINKYVCIFYIVLGRYLLVKISTPLVRISTPLVEISALLDENSGSLV